MVPSVIAMSTSLHRCNESRMNVTRMASASVNEVIHMQQKGRRVEGSRVVGFDGVDRHKWSTRKEQRKAVCSFLPLSSCQAACQRRPFLRGETQCLRLSFSAFHPPPNSDGNETLANAHLSTPFRTHHMLPFGPRSEPVSRIRITPASRLFVPFPQRQAQAAVWHSTRLERRQAASGVHPQDRRKELSIDAANPS